MGVEVLPETRDAHELIDQRQAVLSSQRQDPQRQDPQRPDQDVLGLNFENLSLSQTPPQAEATRNPGVSHLQFESRSAVSNGPNGDRDEISTPSKTCRAAVRARAEAVPVYNCSMSLLRLYAFISG